MRTKLTIKQIREQLKEKIVRMRIACGRMTDDNAREAVAALNTAENCYSVVQDRDSRLLTIQLGQDDFLVAEKTFWDQIYKGERRGAT